MACKFCLIVFDTLIVVSFSIALSKRLGVNNYTLQAARNILHSLNVALNIYGFLIKYVVGSFYYIQKLVDSHSYTSTFYVLHILEMYMKDKCPMYFTLRWSHL